MRKLLHFVHEIGTIMYVGGILSQIVIGILFTHAAPEVTVTVYTYKLQSAYILILPGLGLKIATDLIQWFACRERACSMRIKLACTAFLTINAFVFLVPMMPDLLALAEASIPDGHLSDAFLSLEGREQLVGMSNVIPLAVEMIMGSFRPAISRSERVATHAVRTPPSARKRRYY
ncbi:enoyl-CoA hydratase [Gymnodinialimonas hymeniacidonis]|uniref:enoyl-CoA hydratase n=1 Tax=Gymnodinialimonas hymeniacidonis TaxID=3126508 RepID=UPI0034C60B6C